MDRSTVSRNVKRMCGQGWLETIQAPDARRHFIVATEAGREILQRALPDWREAQRRARALLGEEGFDAIVRAANSLPIPSR
jgi:DNA-binding MarR family transcriptional regulator